MSGAKNQIIRVLQICESLLSIMDVDEVYCRHCTTPVIDDDSNQDDIASSLIIIYAQNISGGKSKIHAINIFRCRLLSRDMVQFHGC